MSVFKVNIYLYKIVSWKSNS